MTITEKFGLPKHTISFSVFAGVGVIPSIVVEHYITDDDGRVMIADGVIQKIESAFALIPKEIFNALPADIIERIKRECGA